MWLAFSKLIIYNQVIVLGQFQPLPLPHIQLFLLEEIFEAFMVSIYLTPLTVKVVSRNFEGKHYHY